MLYEVITYQGFPTVLLIMIVLVIVYTFITRKTVFGRHMYALGGNEKAAGLSRITSYNVCYTKLLRTGAVMLAQLGRLDGLLAGMRKNQKRIIDGIANTKGIKVRPVNDLV